jgi:hypothetical protein
LAELKLTNEVGLRSVAEFWSNADIRVGFIYWWTVLSSVEERRDLIASAREAAQLLRTPSGPPNAPAAPATLRKQSSSTAAALAAAAGAGGKMKKNRRKKVEQELAALRASGQDSAQAPELPERQEEVEDDDYLELNEHTAQRLQALVSPELDIPGPSGACSLEQVDSSEGSGFDTLPQELEAALSKPDAAAIAEAAAALRAPLLSKADVTAIRRAPLLGLLQALVEGRANESLLAPLTPALADELQQECARELEALRLFSADLQKEAVVLAALFDRLERRWRVLAPSALPVLLQHRIRLLAAAAPAPLYSPEQLQLLIRLVVDSLADTRTFALTRFFACLIDEFIQRLVVEMGEPE